MAENRRGKDKRFYFSRSQMVLLGGAFSLASGIIFFLGLFVGKGIEARKTVKAEEPLVKIPVTPSVQGSGAAKSQPREELTFYDTLTKSSGAPPSAEPRQKAVRESEKTNPPAARENKPQTKEERFAKAPAKNMEKTETAKISLPSETSDPGEPGKPWTVQINAVPDPRSAQIWVDRLKNKGYNAYSSEVLNKGKTWYRVRVGRYGSREEAEKIEQTLRTKENFIKAFVTSR
jgi:DedD protein